MLPPRNPYRIGLILLAILVTSGAAYRVGWGHRAPSSDVPKTEPDTGGLTVAPEQLRFGEVWESRAFRWILPIRNDSDREITIKNFVSSCNCTQVEPNQIVLPPGQAQDATVTIDHTLQKKRDDPPVRDFAVWLAPQVAVPDQDKLRQLAGWKLNGRVRSALKATPALIDLGRPSVRGGRLPDQHVHLKALTPLAAVLANVDGEGFSPVVRPTAVPGEFDLVLHHDSLGLPLGPIRFSVILVPRLPNGEYLPEIKIPVAGEVREDIQVVPEGGVAFGARPIGSVAEETFTLRSLTGRPFEVTLSKPKRNRPRWTSCPVPRLELARSASGRRLRSRRTRNRYSRLRSDRMATRQRFAFPFRTMG